MLNLTTSEGQRLEIAPGCIMTVIKPCDGKAPCAIIFDFGSGTEYVALKDQYGHIKKTLSDCGSINSPVEVKLVEQVPDPEWTPPADQPENIPLIPPIEWRVGKMFLSRKSIQGRRELVPGEFGPAKTRLYVNLFGRPSAILCTDTIDEMDGVEVDEKPVTLPEKAPIAPPPLVIPEAKSAS